VPFVRPESDPEQVTVPVILSSIQNMRPGSVPPSALVSFLDESAARDFKNITAIEIDAIVCLGRFHGCRQVKLNAQQIVVLESIGLV
jgi:hypothetical protein